MNTESERDTNQDIFRSALQMLSANIVILDAERSLITASASWPDFAETNNTDSSPKKFGIDYLEAIEGVDPMYATHAADGLSAVLDGEREQFEFEFPCQNIDEQNWFLLQATPFTHQGDRCVAIFHSDITERKHQEEALRTAYEISTAEDLSLHEQIEGLVELARETIDTEYGTFSRVSDDQYVFEIVSTAQATDLEQGHTVPLAELPNCKHVVETEKTIVLQDVAVEAPELADPEWGIASYLGAPVTVDDEVYGTFCLYSMEARTEAFSQWAVTFVDLLSNWIGQELERKDRNEKLQHLKENITDVVWMSSPAKDEIEFISDSYRDVWGRSPESLYQDPSSFLKGIHPDDRFRVQNALEHQQTYPNEYDEMYRVIQPDGTVRWVHDHSAGVYVDGELKRIIGVATDITNRKEHERELAYQTSLLEAQAETTLEGLLVIDSDRSARYHNERFLDIWSIPKDVAAEQSDEALMEFVRDRVADPEAFFARIEYLYAHPNEQSRDTIELADGRWLDRYSAPIIGNDGVHFGRLWSFRDITGQIEREQMLKQQRDELMKLQRINTLVRKSTQALHDTVTREEIETAVCEALTESESYQAAWIGEGTRNADGGRVVTPQTAAGVSPTYLEGISQQVDGPAAMALQTGKVQVINDITTAPEFPDERREIALAHDHQTLAAIPIKKTDTAYGVLVVYAPPNYTISEMERELLADLGKSIAFSIQRVESQRSLTAKTVMSLDFRIPKSEFIFAEVSRELNCELSLEQRIAESDGVRIYYLEIQGAAVERVCESLEVDPLITSCIAVGGGDSTHSKLVEARLTDDYRLPLDIFTDYGATVVNARAVEGEILLCVELPMQTDVRNVLSTVREVAPAIELVSKRTNNRHLKTAVEIQDQIRSRLTKKQENALKSAYSRGYYAWPRDSTMEEIAETFDISAPTLHYRLRKAHNTVIGSLLDPQPVLDER